MKKSFITTYLTLVCLTISQASSLPLNEIRDLGRKKSNFLKNTKNELKFNGVPTANLNQFNKLIKPIFKKNCLDCHGPKKAKGRFRIDELNPDLLQGPHINKWLEVYDVLTVSEMPPEDKPEYHLADKERSQVIDWLGDEMNKATQVRRNDAAHSSFRRLAKYEYNYALQDLLGLPYEYSDALPSETVSQDGFKNSSEHLNMSAMQFETYRDLGLKALQKATYLGEKPSEVYYRTNMSEDMSTRLSKLKKDKKKPIINVNDKDFHKKIQRSYFLNKQSGDTIQIKSQVYTPTNRDNSTPKSNSNTVMVLRQNHSFVLNLGNQLPDTGTMRVRIRVGRTSQHENEFTGLRLLFGAHTSNNANFTVTASRHDKPVTASIDQPQFIEFEFPLSEMPRNPFRKNKTEFPRRDELLTIKNISNTRQSKSDKKHLNLHIDYVEVFGPVYEQWPPSSHRKIFFDSPNKQDEQTYSREVLKRFMTRAWRRPIKKEQVERYADLFSKYRPEFPSLEAALLEVLATTLASPEFLYIAQQNPNKNDHQITQLELANRLAVFLWSSVPDNELLSLAHKNKLQDPKVLNQQIKRMLADSRGQRFSQNFVDQWLGLHGINNVIIDKKINRNYTPELKTAMLHEPVAFFQELLKNNASIIDFIHSNYLVIDETLARHYRIPNIYGPQFRRVEIKDQTHRGGILPQAIISTMNSNGKESNPLKRGIWLLEHFLNDPPPPPPPNVPEVDLTDPKILQMTLKEQIEDHRNKPACYSCHAKIDPWGIAFENYDAIGSFRTQINQTPVDATATLFNKQELAGMEGIKSYLLGERQDQFTRAFVHKMTAYALGRPLAFSDRSEVDKICVQLRQNGDRLGDLVHFIVNSKIFQSK